MLNERQVENNIKWLVKNSSQPVKYLTCRDLLNKKTHIKSMKELFATVEKTDIVEEIFSKQNPDGSWCKEGSWALSPALRKSGHTPVSPKYVTTSWILPILGKMGFTIQDKRIKKACEYIFSYQFDNGFIAESHSDRYNIPYSQLPVEPCRFSVILIGLGRVGANTDHRLKRAYDLLIKWQQDDGGWGSESHIKRMNWTRSCPFASYHAAAALYYANNEIYKNPLTKALKFLVKHLSTRKTEELQRFHFHGHDIISELLMLIEFNIGTNEKFVQVILEWIMTMYHPDENCFRYTGKPISKFSYKKDYMDARVAKYRLFHLLEDDWLTYYCTRIMRDIAQRHGCRAAVVRNRNKVI